jgi:hypothetical protein
LVITRSSQLPVPPPKKSPARITTPSSPHAARCAISASISQRMRPLRVVGCCAVSSRQHRGHRLAVVVDIAGQHEGRVQAASQVHALARQLKGLALPAVIRRIDGMDHRAHALRQRHQRRVTRGHRQMADTGRQAGGQAARLRQHRMAGRGEGMDRRQAEAPAGAKHENRGKRSRHRGIPR